MSLTKKQEEFIRSRRTLARYGRLLTLFVGVMYVGLLAWLYFRAPLLINPWEVLEKLQEGSLERSTLLLFAAILPVMFLVAIVFVGAVVIGLLSVFNLERKYLEIIDTLRGKQPETEE